MKVTINQKNDILFEIGGFKNRIAILGAILCNKWIGVNSEDISLSKELAATIVEKLKEPASNPSQKKGGFIEPTEVSDHIKKIFTE